MSGNTSGTGRLSKLMLVFGTNALNDVCYIDCKMSEKVLYRRETCFAMAGSRALIIYYVDNYNDEMLVNKSISQWVP